MQNSSLRSKYRSEIHKNLSIPFMRLCNPVIWHFSMTLFSTFFILFFKISLCAEAHLEPSRTYIEFSISGLNFSGLFSVTVSEAAIRSCSIIMFAKLCKVHRKIPLAESLYDAVFSSYWKTKSESKTQICKQIQRYEKSSSLLQMNKL